MFIYPWENKLFKLNCIIFFFFIIIIVKTIIFIIKGLYKLNEIIHYIVYTRLRFKETQGIYNGYVLRVIYFFIVIYYDVFF